MKEKIKYLIKFAIVLALAMILTNGIISILHITLISGSSMEPTFSDGQIVRGSKVKNINDINRGDVIIIQNNKLNKISGELIKRVVALPGETITIKDGKIYINGQLYSDYDFYPIADAGITSEGLTLKNDEFFCIGDNNAHSTDCRSFGPITFNDVRYLVEEKKSEVIIMDTSKFKTKTEFIERKNPCPKDIWTIALDIGYSAVKLFGPNIVARFPSYAKKVENDFKMLTASPDSCILYQDMENNEMWVVGEFAQNLIKRGDTADSEEILYGREREGNPIYQVITKVGLGIACMGGPNGEVGDKPILVQTGLPEKYLKSGKDGIIETIAGHHDFRIKIGERPWAHFIFDIREDYVFVMSQPMGTLFSACMESNGSFRADGNKLLSSSCIVFDPGFGTLDIFPIIKGVVKHGETFEDLGMKRVLQETSDMILKKYHVEIPVAAMQKYLATGTIIVSKLDRKKAELSSKEEPFGDILAEANSKICNEAIARTLNAIDIFEYNNFILTGGTGAAWRDMILNKFKNLSTLRIIDGNANDNLAFVYSNVRGYYLSRYARLLKDNR